MCQVRRDTLGRVASRQVLVVLEGGARSENELARLIDDLGGLREILPELPAGGELAIYRFTRKLRAAGADEAPRRPWAALEAESNGEAARVRWRPSRRLWARVKVRAAQDGLSAGAWVTRTVEEALRPEAGRPAAPAEVSRRV